MARISVAGANFDELTKLAYGYLRLVSFMVIQIS